MKDKKGMEDQNNCLYAEVFKNEIFFLKLAVWF